MLQQPTIYSDAIIDYLTIHDFERTDQNLSADFMEWKKENTYIRFSETVLTVLKKERNVKTPVYRLEGFWPEDHIVFVFLMHSWGIIDIKTTANMLRGAGLPLDGLDTICEMIKPVNNGAGNGIAQA